MDIMNSLFKIIFSLSLLAEATAISAAPSNLARFIGSWQAVDPEDGSLQNLTISRNDNGSVQLLVHDSYFALCDGDRGLGQGTGVLTHPRTLTFSDYTLTCFPNGITRGGPTTFTLERDGALKRTLAPPSPSITYYRVGH